MEKSAGRTGMVWLPWETRGRPETEQVFLAGENAVCFRITDQTKILIQRREIKIPPFFTIDIAFPTSL
jgi:hypothetical protein